MLKHFKLWILLAMIWALAITWVAAVYAATEETYQSIHEVGAPFKVVTQDNAGGSGRQPGVYTRSGDRHNWKLAFKGVVGVKKVRGPLVDQLTLTRRTSRHESLFIIDGRLVLLHVDSRQEDPESFIIFGQGHHPIIDPVSQQNIDPPPVEHVDDVEHFLSDKIKAYGNHKQHGQLMLVSMRYKNNVIGQGFTYAVIIKAGAGKKIESFTRPVLLDYRFRTRNELSSMVVQEGVKEPWVYSENITKALLGDHNGDPEVLKQWKQQEYNKLLNRKGALPAASDRFLGDQGKQIGIYYSLIDERLVIRGEVDETQNLGAHLTVHQSVRIQDKKSFFRISDRFLSKSSSTPMASMSTGMMPQVNIGKEKETASKFIVDIEGQLSRSAQNEALLLQANNASYQRDNRGSLPGEGVVFVLNNVVYLYHDKVDSSQILEVTRFSPGIQIKQMSAVIDMVEMSDESLVSYLVLSYAIQETSNNFLADERTKVFLIHPSTGDQKAYISNSLLIHHDFYKTEELQKRTRYLKVKGTTYSSEEVVFDLLAPAPYTFKKKNLHKPHVSFEKSFFTKDSTPEIRWETPMPKKVSFISNRLMYKQFYDGPLPDVSSSLKVEIPQSGLYERVFRDADFGPTTEWRLLSDIDLMPRPNKKTDPFVWLEKDFMFNSRETGRVEYKLTLVMAQKRPVDNSHESAQITDNKEKSQSTEVPPKKAKKNQKTLIMGSGKKATPVMKMDKNKGHLVALLTPTDSSSPDRVSIATLLNNFNLSFDVNDLDYLESFVSRNSIDSISDRPNFNLTVAINLRSPVALSFALRKEKKTNVSFIMSSFQITALPGQSILTSKNKDTSAVEVKVIRPVISQDHTNLFFNTPVSRETLYDNLYKSIRGWHVYFAHTKDYIMPNVAALDTKTALDIKTRTNMISVWSGDFNLKQHMKEIEPMQEQDLELANPVMDAKKIPKSLIRKWYMDPKINFSSYQDKGDEKSKENLVDSLFPSLSLFLDQMVAAQSNHNYVLIVPEAIKSVMKTLILSRWRSSLDDMAWSWKNSDLALFSLPDVEKIEGGDSATSKKLPVSGQQGLRIYLKGLRQWKNDKNTPGLRKILYTDVRTLLEIGQVTYEDMPTFTAMGYEKVVFQSPSSYQIKSLYGDDVSAPNNISFGFQEAAEVQMTPHWPSALYWLATAGQEVPLEDIRQLHTKEPPYSSLILATESEWEGVISLSRPADSYGLKKLFVEEHIQQPDKKAQAQWVKSVFYAPQVSQMKLKFSAQDIHRQHENLSADEALDQLAYYLVNKVHALSRSQKLDHFKKISEVIVALKSYLFTDTRLRETGVVDVALMDKSLSRVFPMTLKLENLPEDDMLKKLNSDQFLHLIQEKGGYYSGSAHVRKIVKVILSQLNRESPRPVPASFILYGESGTGKTALIRAIIKTLGLKYHPHFAMGGLDSNPKKDSRDVFFVDGSKINSTEDASRLIEDLGFFITENHRGFIFFDDVHVIPEGARGQVLRFIRSIVDAPDGYFVVDEKLLKEEGEDNKKNSRKSAQARLGNLELKRVPVNNLILGMSLNFTDNEEIIKKYKKIGTSSASDENKIVATLSSKSNNVESSFVKRFSERIGLELFPADAKSLSLTSNLQKHARESFEGGNLFVVSPYVIDLIAHQFKSLDARGFLSSASSSIVNRTELLSNEGFQIVVPSGKTEENSRAMSTSTTQIMDKVNDFVDDNVVAMSADTSLEGRLYFLDLLLQSFRQSVLTNFWSALLQKSALNDSSTGSFLTWMRQALLDHIHESPYLSLQSVGLKAAYVWPYDMSIRSIKIKDKIADLALFQKPLLDVFGMSMDDDPFQRLINSDYLASQRQQNRRKVNIEYVHKLREHMRPFLKERLRIDHWDDLLDESAWGENWFSNLEDKKNLRVASDMSQQMADTFFQYMQDMSAAHLIEKQENDFVDMVFYDMIRMYAYVIDKALSQMPWSSVLNFLISNLQHVVQSVSHSNDVQLQAYLFEDRQSIFRATTQESFVQLLKSWEEVEKINPTSINRLKQNFDKNCLNMLQANVVLHENDTR